MSDSAAYWLGRLAAAADQVVWLWERGEDDDDVAILDLRQVVAEVTERFDRPALTPRQDEHNASSVNDSTPPTHDGWGITRETT